MREAGINKINGKWKTASELQVGDELITIDGKTATITKLTPVHSEIPIPVYNLEALPFNDFVVAGNVVVHNSNQLDYKNLINEVDLTKLIPEEISKLNLALRLLNKKELTDFEKKTLITAHRYGKRGADGKYPLCDILTKRRILGQAFNEENSLMLIECGAAGEGNPIIYNQKVGEKTISFLIDSEGLITNIKNFPKGMAIEQILTEIRNLKKGLSPKEINEVNQAILDAYGEGLKNIAISQTRSVSDRKFAIEVLKELGVDPSNLFLPRTLTNEEFTEIKNAFRVWDSKKGLSTEITNIVRKYNLDAYKNLNGHWVFQIKGNSKYAVTQSGTPGDVRAGSNFASQFKKFLLEAAWKDQKNLERILLGIPSL